MTNNYYSQTVLVVWWNQNCCLEITSTSWQTSISVWNGIGGFPPACIFIWHKLVFYMLCSFTYIHMSYKICFNHSFKLNVIRKPITCTYLPYMRLYRGKLLLLCSESAVLLEHKSWALVTWAQIFDVLYSYLNTKFK